MADQARAMEDMVVVVVVATAVAMTPASEVAMEVAVEALSMEVEGVMEGKLHEWMVRKQQGVSLMRAGICEYVQQQVFEDEGVNMDQPEDSVHSNAMYGPVRRNLPLQMAPGQLYGGEGSQGSNGFPK
ncbi:hypothetical protein HHK36_017515 [Tetracentron sinense]|uniref:Uncharacterized protein n=1 Tax=Tetracentron sinense TaxID=13715 RepID=A0A835DFT1_TETSI|nr:hypothetical protein HHK36_017515 [Tetracentron sinense]